MSQTKSLPAHTDARSTPMAEHFDLLVALVALAVFATINYTFQYQHVLGEPDLYRVLVGLLDGAESGRGLNSPLHYDREFGFGYLAAIYHFADPAALTDPDRLAPIINQIGPWALLPGLLFFWVRRAADPWRVGGNRRPDRIRLQSDDDRTRDLRPSGAADVCIPVRCGACACSCRCVAGRRCWPVSSACCCWLPDFSPRRDLPRFPLAGTVTDRHQQLPALHYVRVAPLIPPIGAIVVFLVLQRIFLPCRWRCGRELFLQFYTWAMVPPGIVYMVVGCGLATATLGSLAALWLAFRFTSSTIPIWRRYWARWRWWSCRWRSFCPTRCRRATSCWCSPVSASSWASSPAVGQHLAVPWCMLGLRRW